MEYLTIGLFCLCLMYCVVNQISTIIALALGYLLFLGYGLYKRCSLLSLVKASLKSLLTIKNILITFVLIGSMTALWRASGTIASFVYYAGGFIQPSLFILLTFLFNCIISFITGTSLGTASTMGVICMSIGLTMDLSPLWLGGAILSGAYFGDRCSPVSTSALLVSTVTKTDLYINIRYMIKTAVIPFILTCLIYLFFGLRMNCSTYSTEILNIFKQEYTINLICMIPALMILVLALCKIDIKITLLVSILISILLCHFIQNISYNDIFYIIIHGFTCQNLDLSSMINGGGILSMVNVGIIVGIASSYSGLFEVSQLLSSFKEKIYLLSTKVPSYIIILITALFTSMIACSQTLSVMLTGELCNEVTDHQTLAIALENSCIVISPLIPWSIASASATTAISASTGCLFYAFYLYLLPLLTIFILKGEKNGTDSTK